MTTFDVVTTFAERHWVSHAERCVQTFNKFWHESIPLRTYTDDQLEVNSDWLYEFKQRHRHRSTDNYRFDAVRFAHKVAAVDLAFRAGSADVLVWMDADCVTHAPVDAEWLDGLLGGADFALLTRDKKYAECGFMMFRRNERGLEYLRNVVWLYRTDELFELAEWHDSWAWDHVRKWMERGSAITVKSLSGSGSATGHPLVNGPLGSRLDHCKGERKRAGKSRPSDLKTQRPEAYWNG